MTDISGNAPSLTGRSDRARRLAFLVGTAIAVSTLSGCFFTPGNDASSLTDAVTSVPGFSGEVSVTETSKNFSTGTQGGVLSLVYQDDPGDTELVRVFSAVEQAFPPLQNREMNHGVIELHLPERSLSVPLEELQQGDGQQTAQFLRLLRLGEGARVEVLERWTTRETSGVNADVEVVIQSPAKTSFAMANQELSAQIRELVSAPVQLGVVQLTGCSVAAVNSSGDAADFQRHSTAKDPEAITEECLGAFSFRENEPDSSVASSVRSTLITLADAVPQGAVLNFDVETDRDRYTSSLVEGTVTLVVPSLREADANAVRATAEQAPFAAFFEDAKQQFERAVPGAEVSFLLNGVLISR